ncbi:unnamed protein product [Strongylus vulgaris]|uniref:Uncharacterized protein n=1 Tax=Strongylus vulgaris TaxID=40348 RepID=A0A3P7J238_STRVU|nr:unnamed protein product [Strongylus vulgaris]
MKCLCLASVDLVTPSEIFPEFVSRLSRSPTPRFLPFSKERRRDHVRKRCSLLLLRFS